MLADATGCTFLLDEPSLRGTSMAENNVSGAESLAQVSISNQGAPADVSAAQLVTPHLLLCTKQVDDEIRHPSFYKPGSGNILSFFAAAESAG